MNQQADASAVETKLHPAFARPLEVLAHLKEAFLQDFPRSADPYSVEAVCAKVEESMGQLSREWGNMRALIGLDAPRVAEKDAWARDIIAKLDDYLTVRVQGKYYLPAWELVYYRRFDCVQGLSENQNRTPFLMGVEEKCGEIASAARYGYGLSRRGRSAHSQGLLMEFIQSRIIEELEQGVRSVPVCFADREDQIVVLLQVLVGAAEFGGLSEDDMLRMRGFIKIQTEMRPTYKGVDLTDGHSYRQAINRQNALLKVALPFFS